MDVVIKGILRRQEFKRVIGDGIAAMVMRGFERGERGEVDRLTSGKTGKVDGKISAKDVNDKLFIDVGVKGSEGIGNVDLNEPVA